MATLRAPGLGKIWDDGAGSNKNCEPPNCHHGPYETRSRCTSPLPGPCRTSRSPTRTQFPFPSRGPHYLQMNWGDNGGGTGRRSQIWNTSQAAASKSPGSPGPPLFIDRELRVGGEGEAAQEGGVREGRGLLPAQRPLQGRRSPGFCAGPEAHVRCRRSKGAPAAEAWRQRLAARACPAEALSPPPPRCATVTETPGP